MENILANISIMLVPALLAVTVHEVSHGFVADKLGDPTARLLGRITFNPIKHLDPIGTLALLLFGFGWARPVPVNFGNMRAPKQSMVFVALAGPTSNFIVAGLSALLLHLLALVPEAGGAEAVLTPVRLMLGFSLYINVILGVFNLLPVPPLDGGMVLTGLLPPKQAELLARIEPFGFIIVLLLIFYTDIWRLLLAPLVFFIVGLMAGPQAIHVQQAMQFLLSN